MCSFAEAFGIRNLEFASRVLFSLKCVNGEEKVLLLLGSRDGDGLACAFAENN